MLTNIYGKTKTCSTEKVNVKCLESSEKLTRHAKYKNNSPDEEKRQSLDTYPELTQTLELNRREH